MTTQQTKVDWSRPIEAVHEDGRTMLVNGIHDWANDQWPHAGVADREHIYMRDDGRCSRATWGDMPGWRIRNVTRPEVPCNSKAPIPSPELTARMAGQPGYVPPHKLPCWLSSEDVKAEIMKLAEAGADKAVCWDMMQAVYRLAEKSRAPAEAGK